MADDDLEEFLQAGAASLDHVVGEAIGEHLAGKRRNCHTSTLSLENVTKVVKVAVPPANR